jgi:hypothetical protein
MITGPVSQDHASFKARLCIECLQGFARALHQCSNIHYDQSAKFGSMQSVANDPKAIQQSDRINIHGDQFNGKFYAMPLIAMSVHILFSLRIFRGSFYSGLWRY